MSRWLRQFFVYALLGVFTGIGVAWLHGVIRIGDRTLATQAAITNREALEARSGKGWYLRADEWPGRRVILATVAYDSDEFWHAGEYGAPPSLMVPHGWLSDRDLVFKRLCNAIPNVVARDPNSVELLYLYGRYEFGWPWRAMWCEQEGVRNQSIWDLSFLASDVRGGVLLDALPSSWNGLWDAPIVAYRPLWAGLAADGAVFAPFWWLLLYFPAAMRRFVRAYRGRCKTCGYRLDGNESGRCPECGYQCPTWEEYANGTHPARLRQMMTRSAAVVVMVAAILSLFWHTLPPSRPVGTLGGAIERGEISQVRSHLYWGANPNGDRDAYGTPLTSVIYNDLSRDIPDVVSLLIDYGADVNLDRGDDGWTPAHCAAFFNHAKSLHVLIDRGADVNRRDLREHATPLLLAMESIGDNQAERDIVAALLDAGADLEAKDSEGLTPFLRKVRYGGLTALRLLRDRGAEIGAQSNDGTSALHIAVLRHKEPQAFRDALLSLLLDGGLNVDVKDHGGCTALQIASGENHRDWMQDLLERGADANATDRWGETPFFCAVRRTPLENETYQMLIEHGGDVMHENLAGENLIHAAVDTWWDYPSASESIRFLVVRGVNINHPTKNGTTPLHKAICRVYRSDNGGELLVSLLIDLGADVTMPDAKGRTALQLADLCGHREIIPLLIAAGAAK